MSKKVDNKKVKEKTKGLLEEFKKFVLRGNVIDMAVGVIVAGAFSAIVTALVNKVFMPLVNWIVYLCTGGTGIMLITVLNGQPYLLEDGTINSKCIFIDWGNFIQAIVNFLIIAIVFFLVLKLWTSIRNGIYHKKIEEEKKKALEKEAADKLAKEKADELAKIVEEQKEELRLAQLQQTKLLEEIKDILAKK